MVLNAYVMEQPAKSTGTVHGATHRLMSDTSPDTGCRKDYWLVFAVAESDADFAFPVFAPDAVAFFLGFPIITPIRPVAAFGATVFGFLSFVAHLGICLFAVENALDLKVIGVLPEKDPMVLSAAGSWEERCL